MLAEPVYQARSRFVKDLVPIVQEFYKALSGDSEQVSIEYDTELSKAGLEQILAASFDRDRALKYTSSGIQRDDFVFKMNGHPIRRYGSQGQQKSFLIALKLAEYTILSRHAAERPILLLDDLFDKLDMGRVAQLLRVVSGEDFGQIFITDCNKHRLERTLGEAGVEYRLFNINAGTATTL